MNWMDSATVTISVTGLDIVALKKLSLVSHALAEKLGGSAAREQTTLAGVLDEVIRKVELAAAKGWRSMSALADVQQIVAGHMDDILKCFKPGAKITVLVRFPDKPTADFMMTDDYPAEVIAMVQRRQAEGIAAQPGLNNAEQKAQGARCGCKGIDDYCPCQNTPDRQTLEDRAKAGAA